MKIDEAIKTYRKQRGLTQIQLAELSGIKRSTLSRYESGDNEPPIDVINRLSSVLGVDLMDEISSYDRCDTLDEFRGLLKYALEKKEEFIHENSKEDPSYNDRIRLFDGRIEFLSNTIESLERAEAEEESRKKQLTRSMIKTETDFRSAVLNYVMAKCDFDFESGYDENTSDPWFRFFSDTESVSCNTEEFNNLLNKIADDAVSTFAAFLWQHQHDNNK